MTAEHRQMSNADYHADRSAVSWTGLKTYDENPLIFEAEYVRNEPSRKTLTPEIKQGAMAHTLVAEEPQWWFANPFKKNTKKYKALVADFPDVEHVPVSWDYAARRMREGLFSNPECRKLVESAVHQEDSIFWQDPKTELWLKFRMDLGSVDWLSDMKFTGRPTKADFPRQLFSQKWYRQLAHYSTGFKAAYGSLPTCYFIATRNEYPWDSYVHRVAPAVIQEGIACNRVTLKRLAESKRTGMYHPDGWGVVNEVDLSYWQYEHISGG